MSRLPAVSGEQVVRALQRAGFAIRGQRGSHVKLRKGEVTVVIPVHSSRDLRRGTLRAILRDAGLTIEEFVSLL